MVRWAEEVTCGLLDVALEVGQHEWKTAGCQEFIHLDREVMLARKLSVLAEFLEEAACPQFEGVRLLGRGPACGG